jgi:hypothetical protein
MKFSKNILFRALIFSVLISLWLLSASADRVEFCDSIPDGFAGWNSNVSLPKFDPQMGTLSGVDLSCEMNLSEETKMENENSEPANFTLTLSGALIVELPSSDNLSISFNHSTQGNLSGYDGVTDYAGPSGNKSIFEIPTEAATKSIADISEFLAKSPGESIVIPVIVQVSSRTKAGGTSSSGVFSRAGAKVCVSYAYDPKSEEGGRQ